MEIKKVGKKTIQIDTKTAKMVVFPEDTNLKSIAPNIVLSGEFEGAFSVAGPGEYETREVWIMAQNTDENELHNNIYILNADEVRIAIFDDSVGELSTKQIEKIGVIDIVIYNFSANFKQQIKNVFEIDPQVLIPINSDKQILDEVMKELGTTEALEDKKFKCKAEDFNNEEYKLQVVKLV